MTEAPGYDLMMGVYPKVRVLTLVPLGFFMTTIRIPAFIFLGIWFGIQLYTGLQELDAAGSAAGIAWWAHIGGFVAGLALRFVLVKRLEEPDRRPRP